ncbi:N-acetylmuramidase domain-containing protein [Caballeronia sp. 15711]|uniref:N-acetylmuramidase domain-containing protein n=1 Tax=Caballeronia sp. 15711 TaxID=3391029 RepID=UPI0039E3D5CC
MISTQFWPSDLVFTSQQSEIKELTTFKLQIAEAEMAIEFQGHGSTLDSNGLGAVLDVLKVGAAELWAVLSVETSCVGFFSDRRPAILFERHIFSRLTDGKFDSTNPDISNSQPGNYGATGSHQFDRLSNAMALDSNAALQSASWGIGQTMGFNFSQTGSSCVEVMVQRMVLSENEQLLCAVGELVAGGSINALRAQDWTNFARIYNGENYAINNYDNRLRAAYHGFLMGGTPDLRIRSAQSYLTYLKFSPGPIDGIVGNLTRDAMNIFQSQQGLQETTVLDDATLEALQNSVSALPIS